MSKLRNKFIIVLAVLLCVMLALSAALIIPKSKTASADTRVESHFTTIGSGGDGIYNGTATKKSFDSALMNQLYAALTGKNNASYEDVEKLVYPNGTNNNPVKVTASTIYSNNHNTNVSVWFGGLKWDVVFMTSVRSDTGAVDCNNSNIVGDVVLDLWLSSDMVLEKTSDLVVFSPHGSTQSANVTYPDNMYGRSKIRVATLNAGGQYSDTTSALHALTPQDNENRYARFTMKEGTDSNTVQNSLIQFIVQPKDIEYQENLSAQGAHAPPNYQFPNDAYGQINDGTWYTNSNNIQAIQTKDGYADWKNDYVWLPASSETGNADGYGLWKTNTDLRSTVTQNAWLRSGNNTGIANGAVYLTPSGVFYGDFTSTVQAVRPALHLNLTKAAEAANGVTYDDSIALTKVNYTGDTVKVTIPDFKKLDIGTPMEGNAAAGSRADFNNETGEFSAQLPNNSDSVNYEISVKPKTDYVWIGTDDSSTKYYKIHINPAPITVDWHDFTVKYDPSTAESLLYNTDPTSEVPPPKLFTVRYIILPPGESLSTVAPQEGDSRWAPKDDSNTYKAISAGVYRVWFKIEAQYHKTLIASYTVTVAADTVTVKVTGDGVLVGNVVYADSNAQDLTNETKLKTRFKTKVEIYGSNGVKYDSTQVNNLLDKLDVVPFTWTVNGSKNYVSVNSNGYYNVGTYYFDLRYKDGEEDAISFKWESNSSGREIHPEVTIEKRSVRVDIVADKGDLTHIYGDSPASMKYVVPDEGELADGETVDDLGLLDLFVVKGTSDEISVRTNVGEYTIEGLYDEGNYSIEFEEVKYKVTKRPVTLQIAEEEAEYGTDFSKHKFGSMTVTGGKLVNGNSVASVTANADYYLWDNGRIELSSTLPPNEYELRAEVKSDNYDFTVLAGKLTITKANFDMSGVKLENAGYLYDGKPHAAKITGTLPSKDITVTYVYVLGDVQTTDAPTETGLYTVYALFTHTSPYHNEITNKVAYLRIAATQAELDQGFPSETPDPGDVTTPPGGGTTEDLESKKEQAKKDLEDAANKKKEEIDNDPNLTDEEKQRQKDKVDEELQKGKNAIDGATSSSGIDQATDDARKNIENIGAGEEDGSFPWWIIAVIAGVLLLLILLIIIIVKRRNADDDDEYDDYYDDEYYGDEEDYEEGEDFGDENY